MENKIKSVYLANSIKLSGYQNEYIIENVEKSNDFYEGNILRAWTEDTVCGGIIYDIGANIGNHTVFFSTQTDTSKIFAFEPMPENYAMLNKNIHDNNLKNVVPYNLALGDADTVGKANMRIVGENNLGTAAITKEGDGVQVNVAIIDELNLPLPTFVKIDVEGFEAHVLRGMLNTLKKAMPTLWVEVDVSNVQEVYGLLSGIGYRISSLKLENDNNVLFSTNIKMGYSELFELILRQAINNRELYWTKRRYKSNFIYEQKKAEDIKLQLDSVTNQFKYEQKKAEDIKLQLQSVTSQFKYEQKKASEIQEKYQYQCNKMDELAKRYQQQQQQMLNIEDRVKEIINQINKEM